MKISPNYHFSKIEPPFYRDLVDVFEDRQRYWIIEPAKALLDMPNGAIPAVALATNYIEAIESYFRGESSKDRSREFFCAGFYRIFGVEGLPSSGAPKVAEAIYRQVRCGFVHEGMSGDRVVFSDKWPKALITLWTKIDGQITEESKFESVEINPTRYVEVIELHLNEYLRVLKAKADSPLKESFRKAAHLLWGIDNPVLATVLDR